MPTTYYPNVANPSMGAASAPFVGIQQTTNASPIEVTTTAAHGLTSGDCVEIVGAQDPAANGAWQIAVTAANKLTLNGSTGTLLGSISGNLSTITVDPTLSLPNSGEAVSAANLAVIGEHAADLAPWLRQRAGRYRLVDIYEAQPADNTPAWTAWDPSFGTAGAVSLVNYNTPVAVAAFSAAQLFGNYGASTPPGLVTGDVLDVSVKSAFLITVSASTYEPPTFACELSINLSGSTYSPSVQGDSIINVDLTNGDYYSPALHMRCVATTPLPDTKFYVGLSAALYKAGGSTTSLASPMAVMATFPYSCIIKHYRLN